MKSYPPGRFLLPLVSLSFALLAGCAMYSDLPPGTCKQIAPSPVVEREKVTVPAQEFDELTPTDYLVGPNDVLSVSFQGNSSTLPINAVSNAGVASAANAMSDAGGSKVDGTGHIYLPLVGKVDVGGLTTGQIQEKLRKALKPFIREPSVIVQVAKANSQPLYLIGQFKSPGVQYMDRPVTLIQGMALGNGPDSSANLRSARLLRNRKIVPVDIYEALVKGDLHQNVWLRGGDTIYLPDGKSQAIFVFGAVKNPGPIPLVNGQISLAQALSTGGLGEFNFDPNIRIIRSFSATRGELIVVNFNKMMHGDALPFLLEDGDVVYVPRSAVSTWNQALNELLPTLQAVGAVLNPFVQLKFLLDINK